MGATMPLRLRSRHRFMVKGLILLGGLTLDQEQDELLREFIAEQQQKDGR